jgi:hypothetical protein
VAATAVGLVVAGASWLAAVHRYGLSDGSLGYLLLVEGS